MSSCTSRFLLDENVRRELYGFLRKRGADVVLCPKGLRNGAIAKLCLSQSRILVTNDEDFSAMSADKIPGVVWLRIPQDDPQGLIAAFSRLLDSAPPNLTGRLVTLHLSRHDTNPLPR